RNKKRQEKDKEKKGKKGFFEAAERGLKQLKSPRSRGGGSGKESSKNQEKGGGRPKPETHRKGSLDTTKTAPRSAREPKLARPKLPRTSSFQNNQQNIENSSSSSKKKARQEKMIEKEVEKEVQRRLEEEKRRLREEFKKMLEMEKSKLAQSMAVSFPDLDIPGYDPAATLNGNSELKGSGRRASLAITNPGRYRSSSHNVSTTSKEISSNKAASTSDTEDDGSTERRLSWGPSKGKQLGFFLFCLYFLFSFSFSLPFSLLFSRFCFLSVIFQKQHE
ncbi:hypothetical protein QOT17_025215, partial [Balamuthia mandrillaris]